MDFASVFILPSGASGLEKNVGCCLLEKGLAKTNIKGENMSKYIE
jgi:hypothetical protein